MAEISLPKILIEKGLFCCHRNKVPYNPVTLEMADTSDSNTFCGYEAAMKQLPKFDGLGVGIFNGICGIDIDHCIGKDASVSPMAEDILDIMKSYAEYSFSGTGLHIFFKADGLTYDATKYYIMNQKRHLEVYVCGATHKYLTLTGKRYNYLDVCDRSIQLGIVLEKYMRRKVSLDTRALITGTSYLTDESVIANIQKSRQAAKFSKLWAGNISDYNNDDSSADAALLGILAFWCGGDMAQMDRIFRSSGLMRTKWERQDYREMTMSKAVALCKGNFYSPTGRHPASEDFKALSGLEELKPESSEDFAWTDIGAGRLFATYYKDTVRYVPERKTWACYNGVKWAFDVGNIKTMELCKHLADELWTYVLTIKDDRLRTAFSNYVTKWQTRRFRETVLRDAQGVYPIYMNVFDSAPYILNCANGTLHLDTGEFTKHRPEDMLTKVASVVYDPTARCERFDTFLDEVMSGDKAKAKFLQKAFGYGISGDTMYECLFVLYGATTRNGKGTLCESVLNVLGSYGCTARPETISMKYNSNSSSPTEDIARLAGVRFVNISEPSKGLVLNTAQVKSMTGNDTLNARFLHENSFDFKPSFKMYINANYLPVVNDMSLFTSGRVVIIPFDRHFEESEQDKTLKRSFSRQKNRSAILNWLVEGYRLLQSEGLSQPESVRAATADYSHDSDKINRFMEEAMEEKPNDEVRTALVYIRYQRWCQENGYFAENSRNFNQALRTIAEVRRKRPRSGGGETTMLIGFQIASEFLA